MSSNRKQQLIDLCGKRVGLVLRKDGFLEPQVLYCGYHNDCDFCHDVEGYNRKKVIREVFETHHGPLFRAVIEDDNWDAIRKQIRRKSLDYRKVPQAGGSSILFCSGNPYADRDLFVEVTKQQATDELSQPDNLFADGYRSSSANWNFTEKAKEYSEYIEIYDLQPAFVPKDGGKITLELSQDVYTHANIWTGGDLVFDQEFLQNFWNRRINKAIDLAMLEGLRWDKKASKLRKIKVGREQLADWDFGSVNKPELKTQQKGSRIRFNYKVMLEINEIEPHDHVSDYITYVEQQKQKEILGDAYDIFYPDEKAEKDQVEYTIKDKYRESV